MLSGIAASHATTIAQASARSNEHAGPDAVQAQREVYMLWQRIECVLTDARERRIAYLLFHCGLTPQEIVQRCSSEFTNIKEVLSLRCAVVKKLVAIM